MLFELMIFIITLWNAYDRPLSADTPVARALYRDGLVYFLVSRVPRIGEWFLTPPNRFFSVCPVYPAPRSATHELWIALRIVNLVIAIVAPVSHSKTYNSSFAWLMARSASSVVCRSLVSNAYRRPSTAKTRTCQLHLVFDHRHRDKAYNGPSPCRREGYRGSSTAAGRRTYGRGNEKGKRRQLEVGGFTQDIWLLRVYNDSRDDVRGSGGRPTAQCVGSSSSSDCVFLALQDIISCISTPGSLPGFPPFQSFARILNIIIGLVATCHTVTYA